MFLADGRLMSWLYPMQYQVLGNWRRIQETNHLKEKYLYFHIHSSLHSLILYGDVYIMYIQKITIMLHLKYVIMVSFNKGAIKKGEH